MSCASLIAASGTLAFLTLVCMSFASRCRKPFGNGRVRLFFVFLFFVCAIILALPTMVCVPLYIPARLYIVAEAFASIHDLEVTTYVTPDWTEWIPPL